MNRPPMPRYGAARNYPVMPSRYDTQQNNTSTTIKMVDNRSSVPGDVNRRTARGSLPGFQPCSDNLLGETVGDVKSQEIAPRKASDRIRVRPRTTPRGRSNRAVVDILDGGREVNYDDDDFDDEDGAMVGPKGNVLAMHFREGAVGMHRPVDPMYFDDGCSYEQSNSFGTYNYNGSYSDVGATNIDSRYRQSHEDFHQNSAQYNNHAVQSDDSEDTENNDTDVDESRDRQDAALESGNEGEADEDDKGELFVPSQRRQSSRRRPRRYFSRRSRGPTRDDGYSSTGRISESDAGGRSRDPISMEEATKQAQRNFYSRQARQALIQPYTTLPPPPYPPQPQGRVLRRDLPDVTASRKFPHCGPGITLSPHSAAPSTPPVVYSNCPSPAQRGFEPLKSSSPCTVAGRDDLIASAPQFHQTPHQENHILPNFPRGTLQRYSNQHLHNNNGRVFTEQHPRRGPSSSRRPRHSLQGWNQSSATLPYAYVSEQSSYETTSPGRNQRLPPVRRPKVKGILKKTSAYGSSNDGRGSGWSSSCDERAAPSSTDGYNVSHATPRSLRFPFPHEPYTYDNFVV